MKHSINIFLKPHLSANRYALFFVLFSVCLSLSAQKTKEIIILHTNDTHSRIEPMDANLADQALADKGGYVRRATFIEQERADNKNILVFDSGDFSQGTPYYNIFRGGTEIELMNAMGYDACAVGNHEFDFGMENLLNLCRQANFPFVCANYDFTGTILEDIIKPFVIIRKNGLKIGVFGISTVLEGLVQQKNYDGIIYQDPIQVANQIAEQLKVNEKCDYIVCLSHLGWKDYMGRPGDETLIAETRNIDLVLGGHSHSLFDEILYYKNAEGKDIPLHQLGKNGLYIGRIVLNFSKK